ncbi:hypothetical protein ACHQM5_017193 [Ranunculus cassubicifolius]
MKKNPEVSYISVTHQNPIIVKPLRLKPRKVGYILLTLALSTGLSVFWIGFLPILNCTTTFKRSRLEENQEEFGGIIIQSNSVNASSTKTQHIVIENDDGEFWKQPDDLGYRPCLECSEGYKRSVVNSNGRGKRFLMVVVSGGLNQQKNQIADAVVIARILDATLVLPVLHVDSVWGDESEFSDIFDDRHFKDTLKHDVHVLSTLPAGYLRTRPKTILPEPSQIDQEWIRNHLAAPLRRHHVLILRAFDSKLSKDLNSDLQKLRCKVAFHALKFRPWIEELGEKLAKRMSQGGPYMALHLRLEKDVWVRTGCLPGLGDGANQAINSARSLHPELLKSRTKITARDRYIAGLCPLNAVEVTRLLKGLGASNATKIYWAGGSPFEGEKALEPLRSKFPLLYNKWALANEGEFDHIRHKSSILAAVDYLVCLKSDVFMANHGGNMARTLQGHRAFLGHKKYITPNKKQLVNLFMNEEQDERQLDQMIKERHANSLGSPVIRTKGSGRDVIAFPVPECMCTSTV